MGKKRIDKIERIKNCNQRKVCLCKRKKGLLKKAVELSILCDLEIFIQILDPNQLKVTHFASNEDVDFIDLFNNKYQREFFSNFDYGRVGGNVNEIDSAYIPSPLRNHEEIISDHEAGGGTIRCDDQKLQIQIPKNKLQMFGQKRKHCHMTSMLGSLKCQRESLPEKMRLSITLDHIDAQIDSIQKQTSANILTNDKGQPDVRLPLLNLQKCIKSIQQDKLVHNLELVKQAISTETGGKSTSAKADEVSNQILGKRPHQTKHTSSVQISAREQDFTNNHQIRKKYSFQNCIRSQTNPTHLQQINLTQQKFMEDTGLAQHDNFIPPDQGQMIEFLQNSASFQVQTQQLDHKKPLHGTRIFPNLVNQNHYGSTLNNLLHENNDSQGSKPNLQNELEKLRNHFQSKPSQLLKDQQPYVRVMKNQNIKLDQKLSQFNLMTHQEIAEQKIAANQIIPQKQFQENLQQRLSFIRTSCNRTLQQTNDMRSARPIHNSTINKDGQSEGISYQRLQDTYQLQRPPSSQLSQLIANLKQNQFKENKESQK